MLLNEERIQRVKRKALENDFHSGCSQSVLGALQEEFGVGNKESFKAATVLSEGVARQGETCGAIIGTVSALGLMIGRERMEDEEALPGCVAVTQETLDNTRRNEPPPAQTDGSEYQAQS